jgi:hypothetical protein
MKLVAIENVRIGQIWRNIGNGDLLVITDNHNEYEPTMISYYIFDKNGKLISIFGDTDIEHLKKYNNLIGFIEISHNIIIGKEIKDNKLVEIPRKEFEVNDVLFDKRSSELCIIKFITGAGKYYVDIPHLPYDEINPYTLEDLRFLFNKKGVIGKDYEIINDKLIIKEEYDRNE